MLNNYTWSFKSWKRVLFSVTGTVLLTVYTNAIPFRIWRKKLSMLILFFCTLSIFQKDTKTMRIGEVHYTMTA